MKAKAKLWPNNLGWDVGTTGEVWKYANGLGVRVFTRNGKIKSLFIKDLDLDPVVAVERCRKEGQVVEE